MKKTDEPQEREDLQGNPGIIKDFDTLEGGYYKIRVILDSIFVADTPKNRERKKILEDMQGALLRIKKVWSELQLNLFSHENTELKKLKLSYRADSWKRCGICRNAREHHVRETIFRCFHCREWVCIHCAPEHFGAHEKVKWIKGKPSAPGYYLVTAVVPNDKSIIVDYVWFDPNSRSLFWTVGALNLPFDGIVTHYIPKPSPPQEREIR